jgi:hypothetical protein
METLEHTTAQTTEAPITTTSAIQLTSTETTAKPTSGISLDSLTKPQSRKELDDQTMINHLKSKIRWEQFQADHPLKNDENIMRLIKRIKQSKHRESFERFLKEIAGFSELLFECEF